MIHLLIDSDSSIVFQRSEKFVFHGELMLACSKTKKRHFKRLAVALISIDSSIV